MAICRFCQFIVLVYNFENIEAREIKYLPLESA